MILLALFLIYAVALSVALGRAGHHSQPDPGLGGPRPEPERVLIVGATGGTGRELVKQALERGYAVTAFARTPARLTVTHPRLTVIQGDVLDPESVATAMRGQEAVLCALGHRRYLYPTRIQSDGTRNILEAMKAHGSRRLVCLTSLGLGDSAFRLGLLYTLFIIPVILPFYFWDKTRQEKMIARSAVEWVIVRPGALNNGDKRGRVQQGRGVGNVLFTVRVSRADVAAFMLTQLGSDTYLKSAPGVCW
jgi:uncharacterized protein YbjT (DUF2867 family)